VNWVKIKGDGWLAGWLVTESIKWWLECSQYFNGLVCVEYNLSLSLSFLLVPNQTNHGSQLRWAGSIEQTVNLTSATTFLVWAGLGQYENQVEKHHSVLASNNIINGPSGAFYKDQKSFVGFIRMRIMGFTAHHPCQWIK
jgi:hypothetical protein